MVDYAQLTSRGYIFSTYKNYENISYRNKDNNSTYFTFSILFAKYKKEEVEIRHVPSYYDKTQISSLESTQLVLFDNVCVNKVFGPHSTSRSNECIIFIPRNKEGKMDVEKGVYEKYIYNRREQPLNTSNRDNYISEWLRDNNW